MGLGEVLLFLSGSWGTGYYHGGNLGIRFGPFLQGTLASIRTSTRLLEGLNDLVPSTTSTKEISRLERLNLVCFN